MIPVVQGYQRAPSPCPRRRGFFSTRPYIHRPISAESNFSVLLPSAAVVGVDWKKWNRAERVLAVMIIVLMVALPLGLLMAG